MLALTGWDYFVGLVLLLSIGFGVMRGLIRTVFALVSWLAALIGTGILTPPVVALVGLQDYPWVVVILLFIAIFLVVRYLGRLLARTLKAAGLGGIDRVLGAILGGVRAWIIIALAVIAAKFAGLDQQPGWQQAVSRPLLELTLQAVEPYLPERVTGIKQT